MHLSTAFVIYGLLTWTTLSMFRPNKFLEGTTDLAAFQSRGGGVKAIGWEGCEWIIVVYVLRE